MEKDIDLGFATLTLMAGPIVVVRYAPELLEVEREHLETLRSRVRELAGRDPAVIIIDDSDRHYALAPNVFELLVDDRDVTNRMSIGLVVPNDRRRAGFVPIFPLLGNCRFFVEKESALRWARDQVAAHATDGV
jgi:hypothetical protein